MDSSEGIVDILTWDGTLSSSDFCNAAYAFIQKWEKVNVSFSSWLWIPCPKRFGVGSHQVEGYLSMENMFFSNTLEKVKNKVNCSSQKEFDSSTYEDIPDSATLVPSDNLHLRHYDIHIVYSASFKVPVLYFRAYYSDGQLLVIDEIKENLPDHSRKNLLGSKWMFITQEEHPYLHRPWFKVHPCGTSEWMKLLFVGQKEMGIKHYLISWLSVVAQVIGLSIPFELSRDCHRL